MINDKNLLKRTSASEKLSNLFLLGDSMLKNIIDYITVPNPNYPKNSMTDTLINSVPYGVESRMRKSMKNNVENLDVDGAFDHDISKAKVDAFTELEKEIEVSL